MKVIAYRSYGAPEVLRVEDAAVPVPGPGQVRIRVHAAAVTTADCTFRRGTLLTRLVSGLLRPRQPVLGTELAGVIDAVGPQVTRFAVGDAVMAATGDDFGGHAEYLCLPEDGALAHKPDGLSWDAAAALCESTLTALPFLRDVGQLRPGQRVLINGASGAVGSAAVQLARHLGAEVTGVCSTRSLELVRALGAHTVIDYTTTDFTRIGETWDIVFDVAGRSSLARCRGVLRPGGRFLSPVLSASILLEPLWSRVRGGPTAHLALPVLRAPADQARDLEWVAALAASGVLRPVVGRSFSLEQAAEAHRLVETGHKQGTAVLRLAPAA